MLGFCIFWPFAISQFLFYAFRVAKSLIQLLYDVWWLKVSKKKKCLSYLCWRPSGETFTWQVKGGCISFSAVLYISMLYVFIFHKMMMILNWKELRVMRVLHPTWAVWSLGEGQPPEELDKPIDTPPLSTLLIEKPQSATVAVGESLCRTVLLTGQGQSTCH